MQAERLRGLELDNCEGSVVFELRRETPPRADSKRFAIRGYATFPLVVTVECARDKHTLVEWLRAHEPQRALQHTS